MSRSTVIQTREYGEVRLHHSPDWSGEVHYSWYEHGHFRASSLPGGLLMVIAHALRAESELNPNDYCPDCKRHVDVIVSCGHFESCPRA